MASNYGVLIAEGHGAYYVTITRIQHGLDISAHADASRARKTLYTVAHAESDFSIQIVMTSYAKYDAFTKWLAEYAEKIANGSAKPMRVVYPARNFDKIGVPQSIPFGDSAAKVTYPITLTFTTALDLVAPQGTAEANKPKVSGSNFSQAFGTTVDPDINLMLPFGYQLTAFDPGAYALPLADIFW